MTIDATAQSNTLGLPDLSSRTLVTMLVAGCVATIVFDLFGQALSPLLGFARLAPVPLASQTWQVVMGESSTSMGHLLHYIAGLIAYPVGWMFIWRPVSERLVPSLPWLVSAALYGVALWVFALYVMAHLVAGNPAFLNFTGITWVALIGHMLFAVAVAGVERARL